MTAMTRRVSVLGHLNQKWRRIIPRLQNLPVSILINYV